MVDVIKADGTKEPYQRKKVLDSITRAGIPKSLQIEVLNKIEADLHEDITTQQIYKHIEDYLVQSGKPHLKGRYSLKRAIMQLGPTGYPFEAYIAYVLEAEGYKTRVGLGFDGKCVNHEVDIEALRNNQKIMVECKFHNRVGTKSDVQVALYTKARFDDLSQKHGFTKPMLVTNTKITNDAVDYSKCVGMDVMGWSYPSEGSLRDLVEKHNLFPITTLTSLTASQLQRLLVDNIVLAKQLCEDSEIINRLGLDSHKRDQAIKEAGLICNL